ncbi:MAG: hypothetical protein ACTSPW_20155 [Promethearchaeota archaeon]
MEADPEHKWEVATPSEKATEDDKDIKTWIPWLCEHCWEVCWRIYWFECYWKKKCRSTWLGKECWKELRCRWRSRKICTEYCIWLPCLKEITLYTIQTTAEFNYEYYFDVDDGDKDIDVKAELWKNYQIGWLSHVSGSIHHDLMKPGYKPNKQFDKRIYAGDNYISLDIETIQVKRVNTIAIYENGSFYNGHYSSIERMNIVMLNVKDNSNKFFDMGINVILIPTAVFTNTKLHAIIETSVAENGTVVSTEWTSLDGAKMGGIDRENYKDSISKNIECIISKNVSIYEANEILFQLILTDANGTVGAYLFYTTKSPETLGIAADVLGLIPLDMKNYRNSPIGEWPRTPWENFFQLIIDIVLFIIDVLLAVAGFFIALFEWVKEVGMNLVEKIVEGVLFLIQSLLKAIVLAFIYAMFAIMLIAVILTLVSIVGVMFVLSTFLDINVDASVNKIKITGMLFFMFGYDVGIADYEILDLKIPTLTTYFESNDYGVRVIASCFNIEPNIYKFPDDFWGQSSESSSTPKLSNNPQQNIITLISENPEYFWEYIIGIFDGIALAGGGYAVVGFVYAPKKEEFKAFGIGLAVTIIGFIVWIIKLFLESDKIKKGLCLTGIGLGLLFMAVVAFTTHICRKVLPIKDGGLDVSKWVTILDLGLAITGVILDIADIFIPLIELYNEYFIGDIVLGVTGGILGFIGGWTGLLTMSTRLAFLCGCTALTFSIFCLIIGDKLIKQGIEERFN